MKKLLTTMALAAMTLASQATDYYLSPTGSDTNNGLTPTTPLATLGAAQKKVAAGDNVYILPGTYTVTESEIQADDTTGPYKIIFNMTHQGTANKPIRFIGLTEGGKRPVFDLSQVNPTGYRVTGFLVSGCYLVFRNFEVTGIKVNITGHTQSENIRVYRGHHNTFENIACHDGMGIGFYVQGNSHHNLFVNCDGYNNYDSVSEDGKGGQNDGFGCHVNANNEGNIFIGCRAWNNSDDGFDLINCFSPVTFCYSIAYKNGYDAGGTRRQDGNGFKAGGYGMGASAVNLPATGAPRHEVYHCLAMLNGANGIYTNHHLGGVHFYYNTSASSSKYNYSLVNRQGPGAAENIDVNGYGHEIDHNLSVTGSNNHVQWLDGSDGQNTITDNSFTWKNSAWTNNNMATSNFESTDQSRLIREREADGMLNPTTTLTVYKQKSYAGYGCDFSGYEQAVAKAREVSGAGKEKEYVTNSYIDEARTWDFSDLTDGYEEAFVDYNGLVLRGYTDTNHGITTKPGYVSFYANGDNIQNYLNRDKQAADDPENKSYDRCLAFNTSVPGTTTVTFNSTSDNPNRKFQIFFKAPGKAVQKVESEQATKSKQTLTLSATEAGTFFIAATILCNVHEVQFAPGLKTTIGSKGFSSFSSSAALDFTGTSGLTAYVVKQVNASGLAVLAPIEKAPAGTGLILQGTAGQQYDIAIATTATAPESNLLVATLTETAVAASTDAAHNYMFADGANGLGFYRVTTATTSAAGRAYLSTGTTALSNQVASGHAFIIDDGMETGITTLPYTTGAESHDVYDLSGRRIATTANGARTLQKGIYIVNGRKYLVK